MTGLVTAGSDLRRAPAAGIITRTRSAARVRAKVRVHLGTGLRILVARTNIRVNGSNRAAVALCQVGSLNLSLGNTKHGARENNGSLEGEHHL